LNVSEKIVADRYEADGYTVIKDGWLDIVAVKDHGTHWEMIADEVKTGRLPYQQNQKRAIAILEKMRGKPIYLSVRRSRVLATSVQSPPGPPRPSQASPRQPNPIHSSPDHSRPFTLLFLKRAARETETLDEFLTELRNYKEAGP